MHVWGKASQVRMEGLHPDLVKVLNRYIEISQVDSTIIEGVRSDEQCFINFGKGRTQSQCALGGCPVKYSQPHAAKVTWVGHALSSNHRKKGDGYGHAVDMYPYPVSIVLQGKAKDWEPLFNQMARDMFQAAKEVGVSIRWGADWDIDNIPRERGETDNPHFELRS
jgi:peptidoglycan L-alanyl-D-glutamate endopeptidase CwlK